MVKEIRFLDDLFNDSNPQPDTSADDYRHRFIKISALQIYVFLISGYLFKEFHHRVCRVLWSGRIKPMDR